PLETIDLNNELVRLGEEEMREVYRVLLEMTNRLRAYGDSIRQTLVTMAELELIFGKARFAGDFDCAIPRFGERLYLKEARHPLLADVLRRRRKTPVPISLELTRERRTLLISGPNTGGKTVTLKTVGLLSLMAQAAIPVPAETAEFPVFTAVLADIGDYQSIQENLSTFSAHVSNIREMALDVTQALEIELREKIIQYERREKELTREWEKRETAKIKELERRTEEALAKFEEQAQDAIGRIAQGGDRRKADQDALRRVAKTK